MISSICILSVSANPENPPKAPRSESERRRIEFIKSMFERKAAERESVSKKPIGCLQSVSEKPIGGLRRTKTLDEFPAYEN